MMQVRQMVRGILCVWVAVILAAAAVAGIVWMTTHGHAIALAVICALIFTVYGAFLGRL